MAGSPAQNEMAALTQAAQELITQINALHADSGEVVVEIARRTRTNTRLIRFVIAGFVLDVVLTVVATVGVVALQRNSHRVDQVTARLDVAQTTQRAKVLCPLYEVFLESEPFTPPGQTPEQATARAEAFKVIHAGYGTLDCRTLLHK